MSEHSERIQKVLARAGAGSRRQIEAWVREGRIEVNGIIAQIGAQVRPQDRVTLDGRPLRVREPDSDTRVVLYHRSGRRAPEDNETEEPSIDLQARLPKRAGRRWISISPLPPNDGGLEVLTSDGELAQALMRRLGQLRIEFALRVRGEPTLGQMEHLKSGTFEGGQVEVESVVPAGGEGFNRWLKLVTIGGRARDVHRLCAAAGLQMSRILRVSFGPLRMDRGLGREQTEALPAHETAALYELVGMESRVHVAPLRRKPGARSQQQRQRPKAAGKRRSTESFARKGSRRDESRSRPRAARGEQGSSGQRALRSHAPDSRSRQRDSGSPKRDSRSNKQDSRSSKRDLRSPKQASRSHGPRPNRKTSAPARNARR